MDLIGAPGRFDGRRALVTGAARGIGRAVAERLAAEGARLALVDVDAGALEAAAAALGDDVLALRADVADEPAMRAAFGEVAERLGGLDVVVANAAVQLRGRDERADRLELDAWRRTLDVNLTGVLLTVRLALGLLPPTSGAIVVVGSVAGHYGIAREAHAYSASKAGVSGLVRVLAADLAGEGRRVNAVLPGITETPMNAWWTEDPELREQIEASVPLGRAARPEEIAAVVAFLASDEASYVTGALWAADGGLTAV